MHHRTLQRVLLLGAFTTAGAAGLLLADQADAHAAPKPPPVEQPGGVLDRAARLPDKASPRAKAVVAAVTGPECKPGKKPKSEKPAEDKPKPKPTDEPAEPPTEPPPAPPSEDTPDRKSVV